MGDSRERGEGGGGRGEERKRPRRKRRKRRRRRRRKKRVISFLYLAFQKRISDEITGEEESLSEKKFRRKIDNGFPRNDFWVPSPTQR